MSKLIPCPFCGSDVENVAHSPSCYFMSTAYFRQTIDEAWNHRVYPPDLSELIFVCGKLLEYRKNNTINFQLEKLDDYLALIRAALEGLETKK